MKTYGRNAVLELLKTDKTIEKISIEKGAQGTLSKIFAEARHKNIRVQFLEKAALDRECPEKRHQGVIAYTTDFVYSDLYDMIDDGSDGLIVMCDGIEDVHNLGSILRVAECAGAKGVVIPNAKGTGVTEAVVRISAGAAEHIKVARVGSLTNALEVLQKNGYWAYALDMDGESIYDNKLTGKVVLVVGGEDSGVKRTVKAKCDKVLTIPLCGKVNSLNASVALGIAVYEVVRARKS